MWARYGGRGIKVCEEWSTVLPFMSWALKNGYEEGLQIDRINNNTGYSPDNCRFVTRTENARNNSHTKLNVGTVAEIKYLLKDGSMYQKSIASIYGVNPSTISCINRGLLWKDVVPMEVNYA